MNSINVKIALSAALVLAASAAQASDTWVIDTAGRLA